MQPPLYPVEPANAAKMAATAITLARMSLALLDRADLGTTMSAARLQHAIDTMQGELPTP